MLYLWSKRKYLSFIFLLLFLILVIPGQAVLASGNSNVLKQGMSGDKVRQLQKDLKTLGFLKVQPTGYFGETTKSAVLSFQSKFKISTTGMAGPITVTHINTLLKRTGTNIQPNKPKIRIVIDPGHGGIDPGTSKGSVVEKEVALDISKMLQSYLNDENYDVVMTRKTDTLLNKLSSIGGTLERRDLDARVNIINSNKPKLFVSIHVNSLPDNLGASGSIVYYNSGSKSSKALALSIQKSLNSLTIDGKSRSKNSIETANFYILRNSNVPGVLVETAYITNKNERQLLTRQDFRSKIAKSIMSGIENSGLF